MESNWNAEFHFLVIKKRFINKFRCKSCWSKLPVIFRLQHLKVSHTNGLNYYYLFWLKYLILKYEIISRKNSYNEFLKVLYMKLINWKDKVMNMNLLTILQLSVWHLKTDNLNNLSHTNKAIICFLGRFRRCRSWRRNTRPKLRLHWWTER